MATKATKQKKIDWSGSVFLGEPIDFSNQKMYDKVTVENYVKENVTSNGSSLSDKKEEEEEEKN